MTKLAIILVIAAATLSCLYFGLPAFSVIMALLACFLAGLTAAIIGTLALTNKYGMNYEVAFSRSFFSGVGLSAAVVVVCTAALDLIAGGTLLSGLVEHLWTVSLNCAVGAFAVFIVTLVIWGAMIFGARKSNR